LKLLRSHPSPPLFPYTTLFRSPRTLEELTRLPGVARKTANVVASELGHTQGVVVDTHVRRLSQRLGLTRRDDPVKIERDLMKLRSEEHTSELQSRSDLVCRLLL